MLVAPPGRRFRSELDARHELDARDVYLPYCLIDDASVAASEAARAPVGDEIVRAGPGARDLRTLWEARALVRRSEIVHLLDDASLMAAICAMWAWLYHRPAIVDSGVDVAGRALAPTSWRSRAFTRCLNGLVVRFAQRVVVPNSQSRQRLRVKNVEESGIEIIDRTSTRALTYERIYEEVALHRSQTIASDDGLVTTESPRKHSRGWAAATLSATVVLAFIGIGALELNHSMPGHDLATSFARQPQAFTAVFLPKSLDIPTMAKPGSRIAFTFAISNDRNSATLYRYVVAESGPGKPVSVLQGHVRATPRQTVNVPLNIRVVKSGPRVLVRVTVTPSRLSVAFYTRVVKA
jgi:hypothetical protein